MKVKVKWGFSGNYGSFNTGDTPTIPDDYAKKLIEKGLVEPVTEKAAPKDNKAAAPKQRKKTKKDK